MLVSVWVRYDFLPRWWAPVSWREHGMFGLPGSAVAAELALLPAKGELPPKTPLVVVVGDSSVGGSAVGESLPWMLREALAQRFPERPPQVVNLTFVGLYPQDAIILVAKALALDPDVIVYAVSPRVIPSEPVVRFTTAAYEVAFQWDVVSRLGLPFTMALVGREDLGRSVVSSYVPLVRFRAQLSAALAAIVRTRIAPARVALLDRLVPQPPGLPQSLPSMADGRYLWPRSHHPLDPASLCVWALEALIRLCGREGRCLLYESPINPASARGFEPGLVDEFDAWVGARAAGAGVPVLDARDRGEPLQFRVTFGGQPDAIHPTPQGQAAFAAILADALAPRLRDAAR
ncbi:MAG TPA: SGNH/GDSL hydrolase family protein [Candidatus Binatia bacterium]|nr:SGNH/GDSL hydrolase family protein [Candidatus Binatia bacterium]